MTNDIPHSNFPRGDRRAWSVPSGFIAHTVAGPSYLENPEVLAAIASRIPAGGVFLEIGSWTASSAALLADSKPDSLIVTVDNFGRRLTPTPEYSRWMLAGINVLSRPNLVLLAGESELAARLLRRESVDVVLVDGDHEEPGVYADLVRADGLLKPGGVLLAHDYGEDLLPGVTAAVNRFCLERRLQAVPLIASLAELRPLSTDN